MLDRETIEPIEAYLLNVFGAPEAPSYRKIGHLFNTGPNYSEVHGIISRRPAMDVTDENYDFCFSFLVFFESFKCRAELSIVGPYACLMRIENDDSISIVEETHLIANPEIRDVFAHLRETRTILSERLLTTTIEYKLNVLDESNIFLYNGLFSLSPVPWKKTAQ